MIMEFLIALLMFAVPVIAALIGKRQSAKVKAYKIEHMEEADDSEPAVRGAKSQSLRNRSARQYGRLRVDDALEADCVLKAEGDLGADNVVRSVKASKEKESQSSQKEKSPVFEKLASMDEKQKLLIYPEIMKPKFDE